jgi:peptide/nickel transport system permease protein
MQRFLIRRVFITAVVPWVVSVIIFAMSRAAGDPRYVFLDEFATQEDWVQLAADLGLDKPYYQQYLIFLGVRCGETLASLT